MRYRLLFSLATVALLGSACAHTPQTIVVGTGAPTDTAAEATVPGQRPADEPTTTSHLENELPQAEPDEELVGQHQAALAA